MAGDRRENVDERVLQRKIVDLTVATAGLRSTLEKTCNALDEDIDMLKDEIKVQRMLSKYARRTWFEVMAWIALAALLVNDLGRQHCNPASNDRTAVVCDTAFWASAHGDVSGWWRVGGFMLQAMMLVWLGRRSQVPPALLRRVPAYADKEPSRKGGGG